MFRFSFRRRANKENSPPHTAAEPVSRNVTLRIMSGGEPSSIKRDVPCAVRAPVPQLHTEDFFTPCGAGFFTKGVGLPVYQALYRKWRPKAFSDVVGQAHVTETLRRQVAEGHISHAYLFTGTRGTGKTTCAKILAKAVNCEHPVDGNPCNRCPACLGIDSGSFLDVLELDAASNNGVDQVRALRDEAIYAPANVRHRVYIIDEVHMLSISAFNALLKILEEPPAHLIFILATTELHKVPATILSRCQRYSFKRIQPRDIAARLRYVAGQEAIDLTEDGAELLSRLADGALRDALSLLDQCAAAGGTVDALAVLNILGLAGNLQTAQLMGHIARRDAAAALSLLGQLYGNGKDVGAVLGELSTLTRDLLIRKTAPEGGDALLSGSFDAQTLHQLEPQFTPARLIALATTLQQTTAGLSASSNLRLDAELCLLRLCDDSLSGDLTALNARISHLEERLAALPALLQARAAVPAEVPPAPAAVSAKRHPSGKAAAPAADDRPPWDEPPLPEEPPFERPPLLEEPPQPRPAVGPTDSAVPKQTAAAAAPDSDAAGGVLAWQEIREGSKGALPPMYRAFLDKCTGTLDGELLRLFAPDEITKGRLDNDRVLGAVQAEAARRCGAEVRVSLSVGTGPQLTPEQRRENLIRFGSQFDNIQIK